MKRLIYVPQVKEWLAAGLRDGGFTTASTESVQPHRVRRHPIQLWWIDAGQDGPVLCAVKIYRRGHGEVRFAAADQLGDTVPGPIRAAFPTNALADKCRELTISHQEANTEGSVRDIGRLYASIIRGRTYRPAMFATTPHFPDYSWSDAGVRQYLEGELAMTRRWAKDERNVERQLRLGGELHARPDVLAEADESAAIVTRHERKAAAIERQLAEPAEKGQAR